MKNHFLHETDNFDLLFSHKLFCRNHPQGHILILYSNKKKKVSIKRKVKEAILAFRIERAYSKERILELYLNQIYLGEGTYGIAAASLEYFDKSIKQLNYPDAAMLAALPKAPSKYNPKKYPKIPRLFLFLTMDF